MPRYRYAPLVTDSEIRLVTILPGVFGDPISIDIKHAQLVPPVEDGRSLHPPLKEIRETLPDGWWAFETLEGRIVFTSSGETRWTHPDPNYDEYDFSHFEGPRTSALRYEALSYTWGDPQLCEEISVAEEYQTHPQQSSPPIATELEESDQRAIAKSSGKYGPKQLTVRQNLAEVLRHLRYPNEPRTIWIDAICINQNDTNERNNQVKRMGDIYRFAQRVVAWLGPGFPGCDLACSTLAYLGQQAECSRDKYHFPAPNCQEPEWFRPDCPLPYEDKEWDAIHTLFSSQWFRRAWILQEIQLANPQSIIKCGKYEIPWPLFRRAVLILWNSGGIPQKVRRIMVPAWTVAGHVGGRFEDILCDHCDRLCEDPKDKIYAFANLIPPSMVRSTRVDYDQDIVDVYRQAVLACYKETQRLELLQFCGTFKAVKKSGPTWIPDLSETVPISCPRGAGFSSSGPSMARVDVLSSGKLETDGIAIASINKVERPDFTTFMNVIHYLRAKGLHHLETTVHRSKCTWLDVYLHSFTFGLLQDRAVDYALYPTLDDLRMLVRRTETEKGSSSDVRELRSYWQAVIKAYLPGSKIVSTVEGYIGICRRGNLEEGDVIFVILGCTVPIVLRRTSEDAYQVIGDCFVHGLMDGEAILGPLPSSYRIEPRNDGLDFEARIPVYVENGTQREQREDPRLQNIPLPPEWESFEKERTRDDPLIYSMFRNKNTGEVINSDPRLFPEALRERGVPVQRITLV